MTERPRPTPDAPGLAWTVHPAARHKGQAAAVLAVVALATLLTWSVAASPWLTLLAPVVLLASLRAYFLPRTYRLDEQGAHEEGPLAAARHLPWSEVRRVARGPHGVYLSPLHTDSRWVRDRGVFLRTEDNTESVAQFVLSRRTAP